MWVVYDTACVTSPLRGVGDGSALCDEEAIVVIVTPLFFSVGIAGGFRRLGGGAGAFLR